MYDPSTGTQQCRHHDVCDEKFLTWETSRLSYLEIHVKPRIPESSRPYYECLDSLREQCMRRCKTPRESDMISKKNPLLRWRSGFMQRAERGKVVIYRVIYTRVFEFALCH